MDKGGVYDLLLGESLVAATLGVGIDVSAEGSQSFSDLCVDDVSDVFICESSLDIPDWDKNGMYEEFRRNYANWFKKHAYSVAEGSRGFAAFDDVLQEIEIKVWLVMMQDGRCFDGRCKTRVDVFNYVLRSVSNFLSSMVRGFGQKAWGRTDVGLGIRRGKDGDTKESQDTCAYLGADNRTEERYEARESLKRLLAYAEKKEEEEAYLIARIIRNLADPCRPLLNFIRRYEEEIERQSLEEGQSDSSKKNFGSRGVEIASQEAYAKYIGCSWRYVKLVLEEARIELGM